MPQQRDAAVGIHPDVFRRHEERSPEQQPNLFALDPNTGLTAAQIAAQSQLWRQEQLQTEQAVADGEAIADHQLMDEVACAHEDSVQPLRVESPTRARLRTHNKAPYEREAREISPASQASNRPISPQEQQYESHYVHYTLTLAT